MVGGSRRARALEDFDPNASDPEDLDYGASSPQARTPRRPRTSKKSNKKSKSKSRRNRYGGSDDDIISDEDEISEEAFTESEASYQSEVEINQRTGRAVRSAAKKKIKYEEESEDDIIEEESDLPVTTRGKGRKQKQPSLIVKLKVPTRNTRARSTRASSRPLGRGTTPDVIGARRSSRISHDREEPLQALSDSGKHAVTVRQGTRTPEPHSPQHRPHRPTQGRKGPIKRPSAIIEASQETSGPSMIDPEVEQPEGELQEGGEMEHVEASQAPSIASEIQYEQSVEDPQTGEAVIQESTQEDAGGEDAEGEDDSDEGPITRSRNLKSLPTIEQPEEERPRTRGALKRRAADESSDFEPGDEEKQEEGEDESDSDAPPRKRQKSSTDSSSGRRQSTRLAGKRSSQRSRHNSDSEDEIDRDELADEAADLAQDRRERRRTRASRRDEILYDDQPKLRNRSKQVDYRIIRPEINLQIEDDDVVAPAATPSRGRRTQIGGFRGGMLPVGGPFGGIFGEGPEAAGGVDSSDSEDDLQLPTGGGGAVGLTTPSAGPGRKAGTLAHNADPKQKGIGGGPANLGKLDKDKALSDSNPLGVDESVNFEGVGGLDDHINQLKEMVTLPLLYPEVFQRFKITPPRGVLFHGPPGTGKTLLARALANAVSTNGKKVTFYMRKGADALSKWVGEAERQLRLLFEDAQKNQPSIIFFDEIDGLAPVRSSKQEQIHASIVATLLALMDGMDDRGQVVVIGATNRPDSVDPALRRPGRFDREFYFPLPNETARRAIIDIHTKHWDPPLSPEFKIQLASLTKGYGGADLRALCTEAALNAVQGTYPQIYESTKKLIIDPAQIKVLAKDFMISVNKIVPSSARSSDAAPSPLHKSVEPLLRAQFEKILRVINELIPQKKKLTALEEAHFDDREDQLAFERANMERDFERAKVFRPRLLIQGMQGMGQQHLGAAILHKFEGMHVQSFDLSTLLGDTAKSPEAAIVELFKEVRRHKPAVIYIPNVDVWYQTVSKEVLSLFKSQLRALPANDPILVLGMMELERESDKPDPSMLRDLFGYSTKNAFKVKRPDEEARNEYFENIITFIRKAPSDFPDPNRKKRKLAQLEEAPEPKQEEHIPTREELKAQQLQDRHTLNVLKILLQPIMDQIKMKHKKFRTGIIDESNLAYLWEEANPKFFTTDVVPQERPYEWAKDKRGRVGFLETATKRFFYNLDSTYIERRLSNGHYKKPSDFVSDVHCLVKDAKVFNDYERIIKGNEMLANVEVDARMIEINNPQLMKDCDAVAYRDGWREAYKTEDYEKKRKRREEKEAGGQGSLGPDTSKTTDDLSGPITLGEQVPDPHPLPPTTPVRRIGPSPLSNGYSTSENNTVQRQSNGSTGSFHHEEDSHLGDSQEHDSQEHRDKRLRLDETGASSALNTQQRSQKSAHLYMAPNTQPGDYQNSASTTTSGQKTSDRSNRSSGPYFNTQSTNGVAHGPHPDFASGPAQSGGSQLPDTQEVLASSQPTNSQASQSSQQFPVPAIPPSHQARHPAPIANILNAPDESEPEPQPDLLLDETQLDMLHKQLVRRSSGLSVEQLEQVNAAVMDAIWQHRSDWNRNHVLKSVADAFNDVIIDIETMQTILSPSQEQ